MSNKTTFEVTGVARLDVSQVKQAAEQIKSSLQGVTLPGGIDKNLASIFQRLNDEIAEFEVNSKKATTNADWSNVIKSGEKILGLYSKMEGQIRQLGDISESEMKNLFPPEVTDRIKKAEQAIKAYTKATSENATAIKKQQGEVAKLEGQLSKKQGKKAQLSTQTVVSDAEYKNMQKQQKELGTSAVEAQQKLEALRQKQAELGATLSQPSKSSKYRALAQEVAQAEVAYQTASQASKDFDAQMANTSAQSTHTKAVQAVETEIKDLSASLATAKQKLVELGQNDTASLNQLFTALSQIDGIDLSNVTRDLEGAKQAVENLTVDQVKQLTEILARVQSTADGATPAMENFRNSIDNTKSSIQDLNSMQSQVESLKNSFLHFFSLTNGWMLLRRGIRAAYEAVKELDDAMTEIAVVSEYTLDDIWAMRDGYTKAASDMGAKTIDLVNATKLYVQQGMDLNEAQEVGIETTKMARIANLDGAEATNLMTAALRGFNMEMNEANRVNDVYSQLAAKSAADTEEIATAMSKTASIAANAGASFENTSAFLTQIIETTREAPETAGTALKTIIARFQELKKAPSEIGEVDGEMVNANAIETALKTAGVELRNAQGEFRNFDDVIIELAGKWDSLDVMTQRYIATMAAGSRQQSRFIALMADSERLMELTGYAANSAGASNDQFNKTLDSLESKINKLKNAWSLYLQNLANNEIIKSVIDLLTGLLNIINGITASMPGFTGSIFQAILTFMAFRAAGALISKAFATFGPMFFKQGQAAGAQYSTGMKSGLLKGQVGIKSVLKKIRALFAKEKWIGKGYTIKFKADPKALVPYTNAMKAVNAAQADYIKTANSATATDAVRQQSEANLTAALTSRNLALQTLGVSEAEYNTLQGLGLTQDQLEVALTNQDVRAKLLKIAATEWESDADKEAAISQALVNQQQQMGLLTQAKYLIALLFGSQATRQQALDTLAAAGAMGLKTAADGTATGAQWALNAAIYACPLGWILVLILAVVAALAILAVAMANAIETDAERTERLTKAAEAAKEAADEASEAFTTLSDSLKDIQAQQLTIDNMTKGTAEWKDQVIQLNEQVLKLLEEIPELASAISLVDGALTIDAEIAEPILEQKRQDAIATNTISQIAAAKLEESNYAIRQNKLPSKQSWLSGELYEYVTSLKQGEQLVTKYSDYGNEVRTSSDHFLYGGSTKGDSHNNKASLDWYDSLATKGDLSYEDFKEATIDAYIAKHKSVNGDKYQYNKAVDENGNSVVTYLYQDREQKWEFNEEELERLYGSYTKHAADKISLEMQKDRAMEGYMATIVAQLDNDRAGEMEAAINNMLTTSELYESTSVDVANYSSDYLKQALINEGLSDAEAQGEIDKNSANDDDAKKRLYEEATGLDYDPEKVGDDWFKNYEQMKKIQQVQKDITDEALINEEVAAVIKKDYNAIANAMKQAEESGSSWTDQFSANQFMPNASAEARDIILENAKILEEEINNLDGRLTKIIGKSLEIKDYNAAMAFANLYESVADQDLAYSLKLGYTISTSNQIDASEQEGYLNFLQQLNSNSAIAQATAMREGLTSLNPAIKATAVAYAELGGAAFSAEAQVNELYTSLDGDTLAALREEGDITAAKMLELAKSNKTVSDVMANTGIGAADLADYYNLLGQGLITAADAGTGFLKVLKAINASQSTIEDSLAFLDTFEPARAESEVGSGMANIVANFRELYNKGAYADAALKDYAKAIMGDSWTDIENDDTLNDKQKMDKVASHIAPLPEEGENLYTLWKDFAQNSGTDMVGINDDGSISFDGTKIENLEKLKQALMDYGYSLEFANAMVADATTYGMGTGDLFEKISQQDAIKEFVNQGLISEKDSKKILTLSESQLKLIADKMGISVGEAKQKIQDAVDKENGEISINWQTVYDSEGNLSDTIVDQIMEDSIIGDSDLDLLINLGMDETEAKTQLAKLMTDTNRDFSGVSFGFNNTDSDAATSALAQMQNNKLEFATAMALMEGYTDEQVAMQQEKNALETEKSMATAVAVGIAFGSSQGLYTLLGWIDGIFGTNYAKDAMDLTLEKTRGEVAGTYDRQIQELEAKIQEASQGNGLGNDLELNFDGLIISTSSSYDPNGQKTGTGAAKEAEKWEEDYDWLYNLEKHLLKIIRERNKLESEYNLLLTKGNVTHEALLKNLREQEELENKQLGVLEYERTQRQDEAKALQKEFSDVSEYVTWNSKQQLVVIDEEKMRADQDSLAPEFGERIDKAIEEFERIQEELEQIEDDTDDIKATQAERLREQLDQYADLESRVVDALVSEREKEIEELETINDTISDATSEMLDKIQTGIDDYRQAREDEEALSDIEDMESRLALMRSDTSGANQLDILALEDELEQARQDFMDNKIDQAIDQLSRQNELAQQQRERQIELMQWQLEQDQGNGRIAAEANMLLTAMVAENDPEKIKALLQDSESFKAMGAQAQQDWLDEFETQWTNAAEGRANQYDLANQGLEGSFIDFIDKNGQSRRGKVKGDSVVIGDKEYSGIFLGADGVFHQKSSGDIEDKSKKDTPTIPTATIIPTTTTTTTTNGTKLDDKTKKRVALTIWNGATKYGWGTGDTRRKKLKDVFGENNAKDIQNQVNRGWEVLQKEAGSFKYSDYNYDNMSKKNWAKYETGGLADFTGPAWLDGTKARPEYVLNAEQTKGFLALVDMLGDFDDSPTMGGDNYYDVRIEVDELSNDYDVEQLMDKMKRVITDDAMYRNVNAIDLGRR